MGRDARSYDIPFESVLTRLYRTTNTRKPLKRRVLHVVNFQALNGTRRLVSHVFQPDDFGIGGGE